MLTSFRPHLTATYPWEPCLAFLPCLYGRTTVRTLSLLHAGVTCRSNRLQQLTPARPAADEVAEQLVETIIGICTPESVEANIFPTTEEAFTSHVTHTDVVDDPFTHLSPALSVSNSSTAVLQHAAEQQLQQLQRYNPELEEWTVSPDDSIISAAESLPAPSTANTVGGFVGGRYTFTTTAGANSWISPKQAVQATSNSDRSAQPEQIEDELAAIESHLQQEPWHSSNSSSSSSPEDSDHSPLANLDDVSDQTMANLLVSEAVDPQHQVAAGAFFNSRVAMLQQLQHQQLLLQREHLLTKQRKNLYSYDISDTGRITRRPKPGPRNALAQTSFALAKRQPNANAVAAAAAAAAADVDGANDGNASGAVLSMQHLDSSSSSSSSSDNSAPGQQLWQQQSTAENSQQPQQQQQQPQQRWMFDMLQAQQQDSTPGLDVLSRSIGNASQVGANSSSSKDSSSSSSSMGSRNSARPTDSPDPDDLSRGLCLSVFLYCCSQSKLLTLTWQLGLPPDCMKFVSRVADADFVLHVKPRAGEKHFHYDEYRKQAAAKGIPMVDLKNLSVQELQLYLLPVFRLYAGEVTPRDLLKRKKARGWKRRYTNIKLPPA